jgi:hypothetical protein
MSHETVVVGVGEALGYKIKSVGAPDVNWLSGSLVGTAMSLCT